MPISIDTTKPAVAEAALAAGADLLNDVWGVGPDDAMARRRGRARGAADRDAQPVEPVYDDVVAEVVADLRAALERARRRWASPRDGSSSIPGIGFGKTPTRTWRPARPRRAAALGRPVLLGTSRKSTLGQVLDLPPTSALEATLATTALGIAAGVDIVRVHDVRANVRAARISDAIIRGTWQEPERPP